MSKDSKIAWCDATFNPWWGCTKVSTGCANCYAETFAKRTGHGCFGPNAPRRFFGDKHWSEPLKWARAAKAAGKRARVFCGSMCDVLERGPGEGLEPGMPLEAERSRLYDLIEQTSDHLDWLLLTKRADRLSIIPEEIARQCWLGVTVEDQRAAEERIPLLLQTPARVRFLSCEPLVGAVDLLGGLQRGLGRIAPMDCLGFVDGLGYGIHWVIVGGESGHRARPFDLAWARSIRDQCWAAGVPFFFKQAGSKPVEWTGSDDGFAMPVDHGIKDRAGSDPAEWPADLQVREFPRAGR